MGSPGNSKKKKNDPNQITDHHRKPKARGGTRRNGNIVCLPRWFHEGWHSMFNILLPEEAVKVIKFVFCNEKKDVKHVSLNSYDVRAWLLPRNFYEHWKITFRGLSPDQAIVFINTVFGNNYHLEKRQKWTSSDLSRLKKEIQNECVN